MGRIGIRVWIFILIAAGVAAYAGMRVWSGDRPGQGDVVTLRFWNGFTGPDGRKMLAIIRKFNEENPDVQVTMQRIAWPTYYNKLFVAGLGNRAPEVFVLHAHALARFLQADFMRSVDDLTTGPGAIDANDIDPNIWQAASSGGKHWGVPLDVHMLGMFYNPRLFKAAGIVDAQGNAKPPTNREEFLDACRRLKRDTNRDGKPDEWGFVYTWQRTNVYAMVRQWGGSLYDPATGDATFTTPPNVAALDFASRLVSDGLAPSPANFDSWVGFLQGRVGITFEGIYMLPDLERQTALDYAAAPVPVLGDRPATWAESHIMCLRADLEGRELDAAKRFMKYLSDNSLDWAGAGQIPVRKSLRQTERFQKMTVQREFAKQIPYVQYFPQVPYIFEMLTEFDLGIERALRGRVPAEAALQDADRQIQKVLRRYREPDYEDAEPIAADAEDRQQQGGGQ